MEVGVFIMINQYRDNMDLLIDLVKKIIDFKPKDKINFSKLNETFDADFIEPDYKNDKLLNKMDNISIKSNKYYFVCGLFLLFRESFEYLIKYEDRFNEIKKSLDTSKDIYKVIQNLKEDMWPFYPFFQESQNNY